MKQLTKWVCAAFLLAILVGCESFPSNPSDDLESRGVVSVEHTGTEYVPATHPVVGVNANKTNVLFFKVSVKNIEAQSVEFIGRAMVESEEGLKEHAIHFRTDEVIVNPAETGYTFNVLDSIEPSMQYTVVRSKFPTNDYAPFEGDIGKVREITIHDVRAYDAEGNALDIDVQ